MNLESRSKTPPAVVRAPDGLLLVDKPRGVSSHDVVAQVRRALWTKRVGHTGTLDPMATGLLVLAVGEGTKLVAHLTEHDKRYACTVQFGVETESLDADGAPTNTAPVPTLDRAALEKLCSEFETKTSQVPPMISAIRVDGERLYKRARRGEVIDVPPRNVILRALRLRAVRECEIDLDVHCGKGFYVRALARDIAHALGTVGHLTMLRRTHVADDDVANAVDRAVLDAASRGDEAARALIRQSMILLPDACRRMPSVHLNAIGIDHASHGRAVPLDCVEATALVPDQVVALFDDDARPIALGKVTEDSITIMRGFRRDDLVAS